MPVISACFPGHSTAREAVERLAVELGWGCWQPTSGNLSDTGSQLKAFLEAHPGRSLLRLGAPIELRAKDALYLSSLLSSRPGRVLITALTNHQARWNPFAGLEDNAFASESGADSGIAGASISHMRTGDRLSAMTRLLGTGSKLPAETWPAHLQLLSAPAVELLARVPWAESTALNHLRAAGGECLVSDRVFAYAADQPIQLDTQLEPHERRQPQAWGILSDRLQEWTSADAGYPDDPPEQQAARNSADAASPTTNLHITHSWGGGVAAWVESFISADSGNRNFQLRAEGPQSGNGTGQRLALYIGNELRAPVAHWWLSPAIRSSCENHPQYQEILQFIIQRYAISRVIVSSLVGHSLDAFRTQVPAIQVIHDYFPAWPLLGVHPQPYIVNAASEPAPQEAVQENLQQTLRAALAKHDLLADLRDMDASQWSQLALRWRVVVGQTEAQLISPSLAAATMLRQLDPGWDDVTIHLVQHGMTPFVDGSTVVPRGRDDGKLRLVVPGRIQPGKGLDLLLEALPRITPLAQVYLVGAGKEAEAFFGQAGVNIILQYERHDLPEILSSIGPHVAALLSVVPETFSYTLSEMKQLGIPVIATRVGSLTERVSDGQDGWLIEPNADALVRQLEKLAANPGLLEEAHACLEQASSEGSMRDADNGPTAPARNGEPGAGVQSLTTMLERYSEICPPAATRPFVGWIAGPDANQASPLAARIARLETERRALRQQTRMQQAEIEKRTEWAQELGKTLEREQRERDQWVDSLKAEIQSGIDTIRREQSAHEETRQQLLGELETVLQSSSWRITRPLRVARRMAANLARARAWNPARWPLLFSQAVRMLSTQGLHGALVRSQTASKSKQPPSGLISGSAQFTGDPTPPRRLPSPDKPAVSIIIPVFNQWDYTAACLNSLVSAANETPFEVIVVDDHSSDETAAGLAQIEGLRGLRNPSNAGFVKSCNRGADMARGEFIVLLNNDTLVLDHWLDKLLPTFSRHPDTGLAGARLLYPDGTLQEAGGIIFSDGSGWNYGKHDCAERPEYATTRVVDYCSGACIMIRRELFIELGGFDQHYAPAYYEDTDLAFRIRKAGFKVRVQAASNIIHHEGITSGTDISSGAKRYQQVNRGKFLERWATELADYPAPITDPGNESLLRRARDHHLKGRVLVIDAYTPEPDQDSGSVRLTYLFDCLQQLGYGVTFFADNRGFAGKYTEDLQQAGVEVFYNPWLESMQGFFSERGAEFDYVLVSRHYVAANYVSLIRRYCPQARFIFDTVDLHYLREQRLAELEDSLPLRRVAAQTRRSETAVIREADATLVVSAAEIDVLRHDVPESRIHLLSNIHEVNPGRKGFADRQDLFFVGGYQHPPNIDAAQWFVGRIWPLVRQQLPGVNFHLIGSKAPESVRSLGGDGVIFHGYVERLDPWLEDCRLAVAPLRYGAGVKGKVNMSMSRGQPVVATPMAVEGLFSADGENVLIAGTEKEFADAVVRLYRDESLWNRLSQGGLENVRQHFSLESARRSLQELFDDLAAG